MKSKNAKNSVGFMAAMKSFENTELLIAKHKRLFAEWETLRIQADKAYDTYTKCAGEIFKHSEKLDEKLNAVRAAISTDADRDLWYGLNPYQVGVGDNPF